MTASARWPQWAPRRLERVQANLLHTAAPQSSISIHNLGFWVSFPPVNWLELVTSHYWLSRTCSSHPATVNRIWIYPSFPEERPGPSSWTSWMFYFLFVLRRSLPLQIPSILSSINLFLAKGVFPSINYSSIYIYIPMISIPVGFCVVMLISMN